MAKEYIEKVFTKFEDHLNLTNNNRIIFSGKFGIGKSYFLNEFFKDKKYENKYFPIFLNPVNYSISSNEDIFELIKFDILYQILDSEILTFENFNFQKGNLVYQYVVNKLQNTFVSNIDLIGESIINEIPGEPYRFLKNFATLLSKLEESGVRDYKKFEKEIQQNPQLKAIDDFFSKNKEKIGSQYEHNAITQIVKELILKVEEENEVKTILIIDDLDRIDPEHIFRILNIFSAHNRENENKFGFEKIILVCDIENIKSIYHHFYGPDTDFFGYLNKFYSYEPFYYSNKLYVNFFNKNFNFSDITSHLNYFEFLNFIISKAIEYNFITARLLFSKDYSTKGVHSIFISNEIEKPVYYNGKVIKHFSVYSDAYSSIVTILWFFGNRKNFLNFINKINRNQLVYYDRIFAEMSAMSKLHNPTQNMIYGNQLLGIKTNNYGDFELSDNSQLMDIDLKAFFEEIFNLIEKIER